MPKAKCPKKSKTTKKVSSTPTQVVDSKKFKVVFNNNVQFWNEIYKKGTVASFDNIDNIKRFCTVIK